MTGGKREKVLERETEEHRETEGTERHAERKGE
jgi:hypothetical protein